MAGFRPAGRVPLCSGSASVLQEVSPPAGGELLSGCPERSQRGTRGPLRMGAHAPIFAPPWTPFTGDPPEKFPDTSGAQNLSDLRNFSRATGPWVCKNCGWCGPTAAPGLAEPTVPDSLTTGAPRDSPTQVRKAFLSTCRGGACPSRRIPELNLSPTATKAHSNRGVPSSLFTAR